MIKILTHSPIYFDGTSFYRARGILPNLSKKHFNGDIYFENFRGGFTWADIGTFDILFLQRPMNEQIFKLANYAKDLGVKVWTDFDDDLFQLPHENRAIYDFTDATKRQMVSILRISDLVTTSTPVLAEQFTKYGAKNVHVVPNALNDDWHKPVDKPNTDTFNIVWRGSDTHVADVLYFADTINQAIEESPEMYKWHFMGYDPWPITNTYPPYCPGICGDPEAKVHLHKSDDINIYMQALKKVKPRIMHVPLIGNALNFAKSNIAWIEATYAGAVTIAPKWPEWERPGILNYSTYEEYLKLLQTDHDIEKLWRESMDYIQENLILTKVNKQRAELLRALLAEGQPEIDKWTQIE